VHLCRERGVRVQVGGSDQWGNITAGTDLIRRLLGAGEGGSGPPAPTCYGLTFPLLLDSEGAPPCPPAVCCCLLRALHHSLLLGRRPPLAFSPAPPRASPRHPKPAGKKFGKSVGGAVWLSAERLSPYKFYQHLFNTADADVVRFLRMLTFLPLPEVAALEAAMAAPDYVPNTAQRRLAEELTRFVHGEEGLAQALKATEALKPGAATALDAATLEAIAGDAPSADLPRSEVVGAALADVMVAARMLPSKAEVKRMIKGGGVYLNNGKVGDVAATVAEGDLIDGRLLLIAAGKKNKMLIRVQ